jgi:hypothetical protein
MTKEKICEALAKLDGWYQGYGQELISPCGLVYDMSYCITTELFENYLKDHNTLHALEARYDDPNNLENRVKWINNLRMVVGRKKPKNKSGQSLVSDYDMLRAEVIERCEALLRTEGLWEK